MSTGVLCRVEREMGIEKEGEGMSQVTYRRLKKGEIIQSGDVTPEITEQIERRRIVKRLATFRNLRNVSIGDVAMSLGWHHKFIATIENGFDDDVTIREIRAYANAGCVTLQQLLVFLGEGV